MGNKQQLQLNNETLASILSNVLGLPSQESLKHGAYVWKKSTKPITLHFTQTSGAWGTPITLQVTSSEIDVNTLTGEDFVGVKGTCGSYTYKFTSATEFIGLTYTSPIEYSYSNGIITIQGTISSVETWSDYTKEGQFLDCVVSDNKSAYPDGGEKGGYWYEKVKEFDPALFGCTKYAIDKFTLTSDAVASNNYISHSLGVIPLFALLITVDASANSSYIKYAIIIGGNETSPNMGLYAYRSMQTNNGYYGATNIFEDKLRINYSDVSYKAGVEYTLITMA